jgi:hypothetical protein
LELLDEVGHRLLRPLCGAVIAAERRTDLLGFVCHGADVDRVEARVVRIDVHADHPARVDTDDVRAQAHRGWWLGRDSLGLAADLDEAHSCCTFRDGVVDHEGNVRIEADVSVLR